MSFIIEDYSVVNDELLKNESIFHVANGYLGIRGNFEEGYKSDYKTIRGTYINGFHEINKITYSEKLHGFPDTKQNILNVIDAQTIILYIDNERFSLFEGKVLDYKRVFNLKEGFTKRTIHWRSPKGHELKLKIKRMASFNHLELFLINYEIESVNYNGPIRLEAMINGDVANFSSDDDPRVSAESIESLRSHKANVKEDVVTVSVKTVNSGLTCSCSACHRLYHEHEVKFDILERAVKTTFFAEIKVGDKIILDKYAVYTDSLRCENPVEEGISKCMLLSMETAAYYFNKQREYLEEFWYSSEVVIKGNELLQQGIHYNIYQLLQSVGKDKFSNICAKGLSGEGYEGHYFWDTEIYMFPFFLLTEPKLAKNLLMYRYSILDGARENAKALGHKKGALYPWRTITGSECSGFFPAGTAQYHINADIAYSFIKYYQVTEDIEFIRDYGAEVLFETARLWIDTGHFDNGLFKIDAVTGPDEYTCIVNNNYYTNVMAKHNLKWAVMTYRILQKSYKEGLNELVSKLGLNECEIDEWERAHENMYLPFDDELDINPQDDSFLSKNVWDLENTPKENYPLLLNYHPLILYRHQVCKQADTVLAHFLLEDEQDLSTIKNSFDYYERLTTHDSSLSSCIFSIMASKIGYREKAYSYFMESARLDLDDTHGNTKDGIHTANMGGTYLAIVYGFAGLRIKEDGLYLNPQIPEEWSEYGFKLNYKDRVISVNINKYQLSLTLEKGEAIDINLGLDSRVIRLGYDNTKSVRYKMAI